MLKLEISDKGLYIELVGFTPFRTPAEIYIPDTYLNKAISQLKKNGVQNYKIISGDEKSKNKVFIKSPKVTKVINRIDKQEIDLSPFLNKFDILIDKINILLNNKEFVNENDIIFQKKKKKEEEKDIDTFIPQIGLEDLSSNIKDSTFEESNSDKEDLDDSADLLSKI